MEQTILSLKIFLNSLPEKSKFNIYRFGSNFDSLWPESVDYNDQTLEAGLKLANDLEATYGGTNVLSPLISIFGNPLFDDYPRQVLLLTDGGVSDTKAVIDFATKQNQTARIFTCGNYFSEMVSH